MKEAIDYTERAIEAAKRRGDTTISIIVGSSFSFPAMDGRHLANEIEFRAQVKVCVPAVELPN